MEWSTTRRTQPLEASNLKVTAQQAIDFLSSNPHILLEHPHLLAELMLPFSDNPASLVERQIQKLRSQNNALSKQLTVFQSSTNALQNQIKKVTEIVCGLMKATNFQELTTALHTGLKLANIPFLKICLLRQDHLHLICPAIIANDYVLMTDEAENPQLNSLFTIRKMVLGPLREDVKTTLFGVENSVASAAILPLRNRHFHGFLALGHTYSIYFSPSLESEALSILQKALETLISIQIQQSH